ncbi:MAG TPA: ABC transporter ATP-binding protein [Nitrospirae bacterium]|nr:ABC transporter ATP-binding protein [Nitrospirota bacterium]
MFDFNKQAYKISELTKKYEGSKEPAINNISFAIESGERYGLLGPNGAGKTTTISVLCGLLKQSKGSVEFFGVNIEKHLAEIKKVIGVVPQDLALYSSLTARENLRFFGNMYGFRGKYLEKRIDECLELLGLEKNADRKISTFSGGMKRRTNLIAAVLHKPRVLILDEPTVGIDVQSRNVILEYLMDTGNRDTTIIYTTHYLEEAENLCSRIAIMDNGRILTEGTPGDLLGDGSKFNRLEDFFLNLTGKELRD